jgi:2,5-diamino-6-(ribosylamino)-4(3H)-pyrimidinone 5'-phosphate reductase
VDRPFVYVNMAMTADGKITSARREYPRFTSAYDRENMDRLRAEADAVLVGARTIRADDPALHVRSEKMLEYRRSLGKPDGLHRIVVSTTLELDPASRFLREGEGDRIIATVADAPAERHAALSGLAEIWQLGHGRVDLGALLFRLRQRGVERLLVEGGGELNWALLRDDLIDELHVTLAPCLLGGREAPTWLEGEGLSMARQRRLRLLELRREGDELYARWAVEREPGPR